MFTLEIAGRPVAVTDAPESEAREIFASMAFRDDLKAFTSEGRAVWDGSAEFTVRPSTADETDEFESALMDEDDFEDDEDEDDEALAAAAEEDGLDDDADDEDDEDDGPQIMFLIDIDQLDA